MYGVYCIVCWRGVKDTVSQCHLGLAFLNTNCWKPYRETLTVSQCHLSLAFLNTNCWKPYRETLKVHYGEECWFVKDWTWDNLLPRWRALGLRHSNTRGYSPNIVSLIISLHSLALNTNRCKPGRETLKVHYWEGWYFVKNRAWDGLLPRWEGGHGAPLPQHPWLFP